MAEVDTKDGNIAPPPAPDAAAASGLTSKEANNTNGNHTSTAGKPESSEQNGAAPNTTSGPTPPAKPVAIDTSKPKDFEGQLATTNELPSAKVLDKIKDYVVLDRDGKTHTFKSLYSGPNVSRRVLIIFVRHFFCGFCQMYLRTLSESITPEALLELPVSTFIAVVGCGDPALIDMYVKETGCRFPVYTDPKRSLYNALGMVTTFDLGPKPAYQHDSLFKSTFDGVVQGLKQIPKGLGLKSGDYRQVGGEFLFEPLDIATPINTPETEQQPFATIGTGADEGQKNSKHADDERRVEEKKVTWCHRMKSTRDHAEVPELMEILGLDGQGKPIKDQRLWSKAVAQRKGTGLSLASQMSELSEAKKAF